MRNKVILDAMCDQYRWDHRDVEVEFIMSVGSEYTFKVMYQPRYANDEPRTLKVTVKTEDWKEDF